VADIRAVRGNRPQRGDVVMVLYDKSPGLFVKRVVGVEGDEVSDLGGRLEVNKSPVGLVISACGTPAAQRTADYQPPQMSRYFACLSIMISSLAITSTTALTADILQPSTKAGLGDALCTFYWSATPNRIGCAIK